jgi:hypothetical protein
LITLRFETTADPTRSPCEVAVCTVDTGAGGGGKSELLDPVAVVVNVTTSLGWLASTMVYVEAGWKVWLKLAP